MSPDNSTIEQTPISRTEKDIGGNCVEVTELWELMLSDSLKEWTVNNPVVVEKREVYLKLPQLTAG